MTCMSGKSKYSTFKEIIRPLAPFSLLFTVSTIWAFSSRNDVLAKDPRIYFYTVGTIFSNISVSMILDLILVRERQLLLYPWIQPLILIISPRFCCVTTEYNLHKSATILLKLTPCPRALNWRRSKSDNSVVSSYVRCRVQSAKCSMVLPFCSHLLHWQQYLRLSLRPPSSWRSDCLRSS